VNFRPIGLKIVMGHLSHGVQNPNSGNFDFLIFGRFRVKKSQKMAIFGQKSDF
jgi:hypothetical protein